jgi:chromosome segregation ATPase
MDAESQHLEDLKARITELETALKVWRILGEEFKRRDDDSMTAIQRLERTIEDKDAELEQLNERVVFLATANTVKEKLIRDKNQIIRDLCAWLDAVFIFDTWPTESPGRQLMERAERTLERS